MGAIRFEAESLRFHLCRARVRSPDAEGESNGIDLKNDVGTLRQVVEGHLSLDPSHHA